MFKKVCVCVCMCVCDLILVEGFLSVIEENYQSFLGWPKCSFRFSHNILQKNPNKLLGQVNTYDELKMRNSDLKDIKQVKL